VPRRLSAAIAICLLAGSARLAAQDHATTATKPQSVQVTPTTVPAAKVAAAVAEALRAAEAAEARRAGRVTTTRPPVPRSTAAAAMPARIYEVRWPEQRMVVQWPGTSDERVTLIWPDSF
jgi:hypothetical protein